MSRSSDPTRARNFLFLPLLLLGGAVLLLDGCGTKQYEGAEPKAVSSIERGQHLVQVSACNDCHTPWKMGDQGPEPDMTRLLSGHPQDVAVGPVPEIGKDGWFWFGTATNSAYAGPWGISFAMNLTPDEETGLGVWTKEMFIQAIRTGKHMGAGRPIAPPMPWAAYANYSDEDLGAIFDYLHSIPAIKNSVPAYMPPAGGGE